MGVEYVVSLEAFSEWYLERKENLLQEARRWKEKNRSLADDFLKEWPLEKLKDMNLDEYVTGEGPASIQICILEFEVEVQASLAFIGTKRVTLIVTRKIDQYQKMNYKLSFLH